MQKHLKPLMWALAALVAARIFLLLTGDASSADRKPAPAVLSWVCYYGAADKTKDLARFDLAVLDPSTSQPTKAAAGKPLKLGYVSIGEVDEHNTKIFNRVKGKRFVLDKNEAWNSHVVDIRVLGWRQTLFTNLFPDIFAKGFDGVFLDTIDSVLELERKNPKYQGMSEAVVKVVKNLREKYPQGLICQNRGLEVLERTAKYIDFVLVEGFFSRQDLKTKKYVRVSESDREYLLEYLAKGKAENPRLMVLALDNVDPKETDLAREAIAFARKQGFVPYVSTHEPATAFTATLNLRPQRGSGLVSEGHAALATTR